MQKVGIQTTQNVLIDYEVAGLGERIGAFLLDGLMMVVYIVVVFYFNVNILTLPLWANIMLSLPVFLYHLLSEIFFNGQSIGKRQLKIKVVRLDGTSPRLGDYILRWILRPIDIGLYGSVAVLCILINGRGQRLGDLAAGTTVVKYSTDVVKTPVYSTGLPDDYVLTFPQVGRLSDEDIALIRETLTIYRRTGNPQPVASMTVKAKEILEVDTDMPPVKFLNVLIKDYQFLTSQA